MSDTISYKPIISRIRGAVDIARENAPDGAILVAVIHPDVDEHIKKYSMVTGDAELNGIRGCEYVMMSEDVKGFRVVIWTNELTPFDKGTTLGSFGRYAYRQTAGDSVEFCRVN